MFRNDEDEKLSRDADMIKEIRLIKQRYYSPVLPLQTGEPRKTLVLDLDETLVHSSFTATDSYDFKIKVRSPLT
jgi:TFIIF-interacting CTD phosphatase-like protein